MMLSSIRFNDHNHANIIALAAGASFNLLRDNCISRVTPEGNLWGGVVYSGYTGQGGSIGMHAAGIFPRWMNRDLLWVAFDYPFNQLAVHKIFAQVPRSNLASARLVKHLGFKKEHVIKDVYPDGDMILFAMYRAECRFLAITPRTIGSCNG